MNYKPRKRGTTAVDSIAEHRSIIMIQNIDKIYQLLFNFVIKGVSNITSVYNYEQHYQIVNSGLGFLNRNKQ